MLNNWKGSIMRPYINTVEPRVTSPKVLFNRADLLTYLFNEVNQANLACQLDKPTMWQGSFCSLGSRCQDCPNPDSLIINPE